MSAGYWHAKSAEQHTEIYTLPLNAARQNHNPPPPSKTFEASAEVEKVVDSTSLTRRKYFPKLDLTIWENIMV